MKKPLTIFALCTLLFALGATLFAQTTTGTSLITEMKAAIRSFTLAGDLNPGVTGLQSSPVSGKKTGDMLTAGEYNRLLELVAQGGGGGAGFEINDSTTKTRYSIIWNGISWANNPKHMGGLGGDSTGLTNCGTYFAGTLTPNCKMIETAAHDFCQIVFTGGAVGHSELNYIGAKKWRIITSGFGNFTSGTIVECYDNAGGGTGGGGGGSFTCEDYSTKYSTMTESTKSGDAFCTSRSKTCVGVFYTGVVNGMEPSLAEACSHVSAPGQYEYTYDSKIRCCSVR